jgi:hypothetical protein
MKEKNKAAQEMASKRWAKKTKKEKKEHGVMMASKRWAKVKDTSVSIDETEKTV